MMKTAAITEEKQANQTKRIAVKVGVVVSDKRDKTRTVAVEYLAKHEKYGKFLRRRARFHVHDPENASWKGDRVEIVPCRPISKTKSWQLLRVVAASPTTAEQDRGTTDNQ